MSSIMKGVIHMQPSAANLEALAVYHQHIHGPDPSRLNLVHVHDGNVVPPMGIKIIISVLENRQSLIKLKRGNTPTCCSVFSLEVF